jgi:hypothetical protein
MKRILKQIAKENGVSVKEVEAEISKAISMADKSSTPKGEAFWKELGGDGKNISVDDFILFCAKQVIKN